MANEFHLAILTNRRVHAFKCGYGGQSGQPYWNENTTWHNQFQFDYCVEPVSMLPATAYAMVLRASDGYYMLNDSNGWNGVMNYYTAYRGMVKLADVTTLATQLAIDAQRDSPFQARQCLVMQSKFVWYTALGFSCTRADVSVADRPYIYDIATATDSD